MCKFCVCLPDQTVVEDAEPSDAIALEGLNPGRFKAGRGALPRRLRHLLPSRGGVKRQGSSCSVVCPPSLYNPLSQ